MNPSIPLLNWKNLFFLLQIFLNELDMRIDNFLYMVRSVHREVLMEEWEFKFWRLPKQLADFLLDNIPDGDGRWRLSCHFFLGSSYTAADNCCEEIKQKNVDGYRQKCVESDAKKFSTLHHINVVRAVIEAKWLSQQNRESFW